jgi:hypothetical protein
MPPGVTRIQRLKLLSGAGFMQYNIIPLTIIVFRLLILPYNLRYLYSYSKISKY